MKYNFKQIRKNKIAIYISILLAAMIFTSAIGSGLMRAEAQSFSATLSGNSESPPTKSNSTATAQFQVNENNSKVSYWMNVTGIKKITQASIRNGSQSESGDIVVLLSKSKSAKGEEKPPKISISGNITKDDLRGPLKGKDLSELISLMSKERAYTNIQTEKYPNGAIRGQIASESIGATENATTMEQPPEMSVNVTNATASTANITGEVSTGLENRTPSNVTKVREFPSNQSTSAPNLDIDESMK